MGKRVRAIEFLVTVGLQRSGYSGSTVEDLTGTRQGTVEGVIKRTTPACAETG